MVELELDLQEFLGGLRGYPSLVELKELCVYDDTLIEGAWLEGLIQDLDRLIDALQASSFEHEVPARVGTTFDEDIPRDFGQAIMLDWARSLRTLAFRAKSLGIPLHACGN